MPIVPVKFYVKHADGSAVTQAQEITLKDPVTGRKDYEFWTDAAGYVQRAITTKQYNAFTNDGCAKLIGVNAPMTVTLQNSCAI